MNECCCNDGKNTPRRRETRMMTLPVDRWFAVIILTLFAGFGCRAEKNAPASRPAVQSAAVSPPRTAAATASAKETTKEHAPNTRPATNAAAAQHTGAGGKPLAALDLGLDADAVTQATPGCPKCMKPPHLREEKKRPPFMVPPGTKNIARFKPCSCSDERPVTGVLEQITDGLKKSSPFHFVELGPGPRWIQIDLEAVQTIYAVVIWHHYKNPVIYNDVIVRIAEELPFDTNATTLFNNDHDNSSGLGTGEDTAFYSRWWGEIVDARGPDMKGTPARYIRVHTANGMEYEPPRFVEIAVYGTKRPEK